ncbi:MAG: HEAT repeat domain-containing protein [Planctomycetaceae bacterium]|nr:HEAT repeat domain-containing protein [Planctomycetaceae bacterium]
MKKLTYKLLCTLMAAAFCAAAFAQDPDWHVIPKDDLAGNRGELAKILQTTATEEQCLEVMQRESDVALVALDENTLYLKMLAGKRLATHGTAKSVPVLVAMLEKYPEGFFARYALETIPGAEVDAALCEALPNLKEPTVIAGVLTTLGVRGNAASEKTIFGFVKNDDADVRNAAAYAYSSCVDVNNTIGDPDTVDFNDELVDAALLLAELFAAKGDKDAAVNIYEHIAKADNIKAYRKESGTYQHILALGNEGIEELVTNINSPDIKMFLVAMKAGRQLPAGDAVTKAMIEQLDKQDNPLRKALLVRAIGDRTDDVSKAMSRGVISQLAQSGDEVVRVAAIDALRNIGNPTVLPILIAAANQSDSQAIADAAKKTLAELPGKEVDAAIVDLLEKGNAATKILAIKLIEERRIITAFAQLKKGLEDSDANVQKAALDALGQVASIDELPVLLDVLSRVTNQDELKELQNVLMSACTRMPQEAAATEVSKMIPTSPRPIQLFQMDMLMQIAGPKAVATVESYAWGNDVPLKDKATALLGTWRSPPDIELIAAACLKLAKEATDDRFKIRGVRGLIRLARQFDMSEQRKLEIAKQVFDVAERDDDKVLVFDVYSRNPTTNMLAAAMAHIDNPTFREKACESAVIIGERAPDKLAAIPAAMRAVLEKSTNADMKARAQRVLDRQ